MPIQPLSHLSERSIDYSRGYTAGAYAAMSLAPGDRVGPYQVVALLGAGGMGLVYRARDTRLRRDVALKVISDGMACEPEHLKRFQDEARAAGALQHPAILAVYDVGTHEGAPFIVSELLDGETLRERLREGALPPRKAIEHAAHVARGLAVAHDKGVVHRDIKPENLFLTADGRVKILDFGLAKLRPAAAESDQSAPAHGHENARGHDPRHRGLHGARAGARQAGRPAIRHLLAGGGAPRDGFGSAAVPRRDARRRDDGDPEGGPTRASAFARHAGAGADHPPLSGEAARRQVPVRARPRLRPRVRLEPFRQGGHDRPVGRDPRKAQAVARGPGRARRRCVARGRGHARPSVRTVARAAVHPHDPSARTRDLGAVLAGRSLDPLHRGVRRRADGASSPADGQSRAAAAWAARRQAGRCDPGRNRGAHGGAAGFRGQGQHLVAPSLRRRRGTPGSGGGCRGCRLEGRWVGVCVRSRGRPRVPHRVPGRPDRPSNHRRHRVHPAVAVRRSPRHRRTPETGLHRFPRPRTRPQRRRPRVQSGA